MSRFLMERFHPLVSLPLFSSMKAMYLHIVQRHNCAQHAHGFRFVCAHGIGGCLGAGRADAAAAAVSFSTFGLSDAVLRAVYDVGYESPSPIQAETIAPLLEGHDVIGQAQTGTGKTAAFALPLSLCCKPSAR